MSGHDPEQGCSDCPELVEHSTLVEGCGRQPDDAWPGEPGRVHLKVSHYWVAPDWCPLRSDEASP